LYKNEPNIQSLVIAI